jgi:hypothetical protein
MRITRLALLIVPLLLFACDREPVAPNVDVAPQFAATSEWIEYTSYSPEGDVFWYAPCIDDYVDEIGPVHVKRHRVIQDDGVAVVRWNVRWGSDFIIRGTVTGDWYAVPGSHNNVITTANVGYHQSRTLRWVFKNATTGMVIDWSWRWTFVMNANGEWTVQRDVAPCKVRHG